MSLGGVKPDWYLYRDNYKLVLCSYIFHEKKSQPFYDFEGILLLVDRLAGLHDALHAAGNDGRHRGELCGEVLLQVGTIAKAFLQVHMDARD